MEVLTFKFLRELQKKERDSAELQKLDETFYSLVAEYLASKERLAKVDATNSFSEQKEMENLMPVIEYILDRREQKIVSAALKASRSDIKMKNMLPQEEELFDKLCIIIKDFRNKIEQSLKEPKRETKDIKKLQLKLLCEIPAIVAEDGQSYGPFKEGDVYSIPSKTAEILIKNEKAMEI